MSFVSVIATPETSSMSRQHKQSVRCESGRSVACEKASANSNQRLRSTRAFASLDGTNVRSNGSVMARAEFKASNETKSERWGSERGLVQLSSVDEGEEVPDEVTRPLHRYLHAARRREGDGCDTQQNRSQPSERRQGSSVHVLPHVVRSDEMSNVTMMNGWADDRGGSGTTLFRGFRSEIGEDRI